MKDNSITIIDYRAGNIQSVYNALKFIGCTPVVTSDPATVLSSSTLLLPGVGSFSTAINSLRHLGLDEAIYECVVNKQRKILGICLGFQLLFSSSTEGGYSSGLNLLNGDITHLLTRHEGHVKVPHIGYNSVSFCPLDPLYKDLDPDPDFYFLHSYCYSPPIHRSDTFDAITTYPSPFVSSVHRHNIFGTQFHPEKSQSNGLQLLSNYLTFEPC